MKLLAIYAVALAATFAQQAPFNGFSGWRIPHKTWTPMLSPEARGAAYGTPAWHIIKNNGATPKLRQHGWRGPGVVELDPRF